MSEYQYYEFLAIDRPLTREEMQEVRRYSSRAEITPTSFMNEYNWGDFRGDVKEFMTHYFDAFVYLANWGTRELWFRLPRSDLDMERAGRYCSEGFVELHVSDDCAVLALRSEDEGGEWEEGPGWMASLAPLREDLLAGDYRCLYLGWLSGVESWELEEEDAEPPVPPGLGKLTVPLETLADFLRLDSALLKAAAAASPPLPEASDSPDRIRSWIQALPVKEKDAMLFRLSRESPKLVQREMLRRYRQEAGPRSQAPIHSRRTVGQIRKSLEQLRQKAERRAAQKMAKEEARRQEAAAEARRKRLDALLGKEAACWQQAEDLIRARNPKSYDEAVALLRDLVDLAAREGDQEETAQRLAVIKTAHRRKVTFMQRLEAAGL